MEFIGDKQPSRLARCFAAGVILAGLGGPAHAQSDWHKVDVLRPYSPGGLGPNHFGTSISLYGHGALVGSEGLQGGIGAAFLYGGHHGHWHGWAVLTEDLPDPDSGFGKAVALGEGIAFVGAPDADGGAGVAYVYEQVGNTSSWPMATRLQRLIRQPDDGYGTATAVNGNSALVSAPGVDQVHVYVPDGDPVAYGVG